MCVTSFVKQFAKRVPKYTKDKSERNRQRLSYNGMVAAGDYKRTMIKNVILTEIIDFFLISRDIYDGGTDLVISKYQAQQFEIWNKWV